MIHDLQLIKVGKVYDNGTPAVAGFDLAVAKGEFIAFLGPSGCGKTTTLRMIAGFEAISSGDVMIKGVRINDVPPERRPTSMIFQNYALFPHMTVRRNIGYGLEVKGLPKAERDAKVDHMLATLGLEDVADKRPDKLSGGQRQRIALARGLVVEPDILLLDEPLGALDANLRKAIQNELKLLQKRLGVTFVFVTHAQSEALALSDRIVVMNQGRVEQISPPHQLYTRPNTPFVAQFIGRNTILDGAVGGIEDGRVVVDTPLGRLRGTANGALAEGSAAKIVVPAEAIEVRAAAGEPAAGAGNAVAATVRRLDVVGHISHLSVELPGGRALSLEAHIDKYPPGAFAPGADIVLAWSPAEATVIPAA
ncbi:ABC transporter ATP-binding protein [Labrys wisconsinensis]|uniref:Spermidine/putrescine transport system ATP-binding protein/spermidine/putrescine transport system ATP-binding protein n=1 Tax=Labrys wisconsinensis TaxID=425677 RepID=A0ABU0JD23_9HYPH|nr:ABC transporter ATP-binding protein [Labrys wisconsinensis]MDQ0472176.1 putative spermidine/putrescine transport system ATP-binding protein/spermidine/putrescine transport system ATP-binding protein [Labrys wisconsinensis]